VLMPHRHPEDQIYTDISGFFYICMWFGVATFQQQPTSINE